MNRDKVRIFRVADRPSFTKIDNRAIGVAAVSFRAQGILHYLLSKPDNWAARATDIQRHGREGRGAVQTAIVELESAGFLVRNAARDDKGTFEGIEFLVYEIPQNQAEKPGTGNQHIVKNRAPESASIITTEETTTEKPSAAPPPKPAKKPRPKTADIVKFEFVWPDGLKTAFIEFFDYRRQLRKPMTETGSIKLQHKLEKMGHAKALQALNNSMENGWQGVFDPSPDSPRLQPAKPAPGASKPTTEVRIYE